MAALPPRRSPILRGPQPGQGQVLVRVRAAGVNGIDWTFREGHVRDAFPLRLPAVLGIELAGVVEALGPGASRFGVGDRVIGPLGGLGAYADFVTVAEANLVRTPQGLDDVHAAGVPVAAVAAWHSLHHAGPIAAGQRTLIHGAAGGAGRLCRAVRQAGRRRSLRNGGDRARGVRAQPGRGPRHRLSDPTLRVGRAGHRSGARLRRRRRARSLVAGAGEGRRDRRHVLGRHPCAHASRPPRTVVHEQAGRWSSR